MPRILRIENDQKVLRAGGQKVLRLNGAGSGDKHYTQAFISASGLTVTHNLGKYPAVTVHDSADEEVEVEVEHTNTNELVLSWRGTFSGRVTCN
jgi:hypothetical protein